jgi:hypothetical protein
LSSNKNIAIVGMLNVNINASKMVDSVLAGTFFVDLSSPAKEMEMSPGDWCTWKNPTVCFGGKGGLLKLVAPYFCLRLLRGE